MVGGDISLEESYDAYPRVEGAFQELLDESLHPRGPETLYELVGSLNLPKSATVVDVGCGEGEKTIELARRFGFNVHGIDPVERHIEVGRQALLDGADADLVDRVRFSAGRAEELAVEDASVDLIWCTEVLMYADLDRAFGEFHRIVRPGGRGLVYQVFTGPLMSDDEAEKFWRDLGAPASSARPQHVEEAIARAGLVVEEHVQFGSEWGEKAEENTGAGTRRLLHTARLLREPDRYINQFGRIAYRIMLGDCLWHVYRMVGRLTGDAYIFAKPTR